jgi:predicted Zn-dependent peptidase
LKQLISEGVLDNGIQVVTETTPWSRSVAIGIWVNRGSRDDLPGKTGLLHFFEHMVFRGTRSYNGLEIAKSLERYGGSLNAFTGKEQTCFYAHVALEHFKDAAKILRELVFYPTFPDEYIEREKLVVLDEIKALEDNPEDVVHERLYRMLWPDNPVGGPIIGTAEHVSAFRRSDLVDAHDRILGSPIFITAVGNIKFEEVAGFFSSCTAGGTKTAARKKAVADGHGYKSIKKDISQAYLALGTSTFPYSDGDRYALSVLNTIFGDGMGSRLFQNIREKYGLAYSIFSTIDFFSDAGFFNILAGTEPSNVKRVLSLISEEIESVKNRNITPDELDYAKTHIKGSLILASENVNHRMGRIARGKIYLGRPETLSDTLSTLEKVDLDRISRVVNMIFDKLKFCLVIAAREDEKNFFNVLDF